MNSDVNTFLARIGQPDLAYVDYSIPSDVELAKRFPLLAHLLRRLPPARPAAAAGETGR